MPSPESRPDKKIDYQAKVDALGVQADSFSASLNSLETGIKNKMEVKVQDLKDKIEITRQEIGQLETGWLHKRGFGEELEKINLKIQAVESDIYSLDQQIKLEVEAAEEKKAIKQIREAFNAQKIADYSDPNKTLTPDQKKVLWNKVYNNLGTIPNTDILKQWADERYKEWVKADSRTPGAVDASTGDYVDLNRKNKQHGQSLFETIDYGEQELRREKGKYDDIDLEILNDRLKFKEKLSEGDILKNFKEALEGLNLEEDPTATLPDSIINATLNKLTSPDIKMDRDQAKALLSRMSDIYREEILGKATRLKEQSEGVGDKGISARKVKTEVKTTGGKIRVAVKGILVYAGVSKAATLGAAALGASALGPIGAGIVVGAAVGVGLIYGAGTIERGVKKLVNKVLGRKENKLSQQTGIESKWLNQARNEVNQSIDDIVSKVLHIEYSREKNGKLVEKVDTTIGDQVNQAMGEFVELSMKSSLLSHNELAGMTTWLDKNKVDEYFAKQVCRFSLEELNQAGVGGSTGPRELSAKEFFDAATDETEAKNILKQREFLPRDFEAIKKLGLIKQGKEDLFSRKLNSVRNGKLADLESKHIELNDKINQIGKKFVQAYIRSVDNYKKLSKSEKKQVENYAIEQATRLMTKLQDASMGELRFENWVNGKISNDKVLQRFEKVMKHKGFQLITRSDQFFKTTGNTLRDRLKRMESIMFTHGAMGGLAAIDPHLSMACMAVSTGVRGYYETRQDITQIKRAEIKTARQEGEIMADLNNLVDLEKLSSQTYVEAELKSILQEIPKYRGELKANRYLSIAARANIESKIDEIQHRCMSEILILNSNKTRSQRLDKTKDLQTIYKEVHEKKEAKAKEIKEEELKIRQDWVRTSLKAARGILHSGLTIAGTFYLAPEIHKGIQLGTDYIATELEAKAFMYQAGIKDDSMQEQILDSLRSDQDGFTKSDLDTIRHELPDLIKPGANLKSITDGLKAAAAMTTAQEAPPTVVQPPEVVNQQAEEILEKYDLDQDQENILRNFGKSMGLVGGDQVIVVNRMLGLNEATVQTMTEQNWQNLEDNLKSIQTMMAQQPNVKAEDWASFIGKYKQEFLGNDGTALWTQEADEYNFDDLLSKTEIPIVPLKTTTPEQTPRTLSQDLQDKVSKFHGQGGRVEFFEDQGSHGMIFEGIGQKGNYAENVIYDYTNYGEEGEFTNDSIHNTQVEAQRLNEAQNILKLEDGSLSVEKLFPGNQQAAELWDKAGVELTGDGKLVIKDVTAFEEFSQMLENRAKGIDIRGATAFVSNIDRGVEFDENMVRQARHDLDAAHAARGLPLEQGTLHSTEFGSVYRQGNYTFTLNQANGGHQIEVRGGEITKFGDLDIKQGIEVKGGWDNVKHEIIGARLESIDLNLSANNAAEALFINDNFELSDADIKEVFAADKALEGAGVELSLFDTKVMVLDNKVEVESYDRGTKVHIRWQVGDDWQLLRVGKESGVLYAINPDHDVIDPNTGLDKASPLTGEPVKTEIKPSDLQSPQKLGEVMNKLDRHVETDRQDFENIMTQVGQRGFFGHDKLASSPNGPADLGRSFQEITMEDVAMGGQHLHDKLETICKNDNNIDNIEKIMKTTRQSLEQEGLINSQGVKPEVENMTIGEWISQGNGRAETQTEGQTQPETQPAPITTETGEVIEPKPVDKWKTSERNAVNQALSNYHNKQDLPKIHAQSARASAEEFIKAHPEFVSHPEFARAYQELVLGIPEVINQDSQHVDIKFDTGTQTRLDESGYKIVDGRLQVSGPKGSASIPLQNLNSAEFINLDNGKLGIELTKTDGNKQVVELVEGPIDDPRQYFKLIDQAPKRPVVPIEAEAEDIPDEVTTEEIKEPVLEKVPPPPEAPPAGSLWAETPETIDDVWFADNTRLETQLKDNLQNWIDQAKNIDTSKAMTQDQQDKVGQATIAQDVLNQGSVIETIRHNKWKPNPDYPYPIEYQKQAVSAILEGIKNQTTTPQAEDNALGLIQGYINKTK